MPRLSTKIYQTGKTLNIRYKEHIHALRNISSNSQYSNHILNTGHTYRTITGEEGKHLNTLEKYHIYRTSKDYVHVSDTYMDIYNPIFEIYKLCAR
jgi:hypothetical protein